MSLSLVLIPLLSVVVTISLSISNVYGLTNVNNTYFSINIPDSWVYAKYSNTPEAERTGSGLGNMVWLTPNESSDLLLTPDFDKLKEKMQDGGAILYFVQDTGYPLKNAPLETYVKYSLDQLGIANVTSQQNTSVGKEKSIRIEANESSTYGSNNIALYSMMHDNEPYYILFVANANNYEKYLPEFEQMVKTFKFANKIESLF